MSRIGSHAPSRRAVLAGAAALAAPAILPGLGRAVSAQGFGEAADRAARLDQLNSLIIAHGGEIALEKSFRGPALDRAVNIKSVSKTICATLAGIALARGEIDGVNQRALDFVAAPAGADPRVGEITIEDLLTMRAGLERTSGANYGGWVASRNWVADALGRPFVAEPGGRFLYSTGSFHILGAVLAKAAEKTLLTLARERLGAPLDVDIPPWTQDPQGRYMGGNNMALSPMALLRFGELWRRRGVWRNERVIGEAWIEASWTPRTRSPYSGHDYGYGWFLAEAGGRRIAYARGYGGQMIYVVPDLALTVVVTSDPTRPARSSGHVGDLNALLGETIIPAAAAG